MPLLCLLGQLLCVRASLLTAYLTRSEHRKRRDQGWDQSSVYFSTSIKAQAPQATPVRFASCVEDCTCLVQGVVLPLWQSRIRQLADRRPQNSLVLSLGKRYLLDPLCSGLPRPDSTHIAAHHRSRNRPQHARPKRSSPGRREGWPTVAVLLSINSTRSPLLLRPWTS